MFFVFFVVVPSHAMCVPLIATPARLGPRNHSPAGYPTPHPHALHASRGALATRATDSIAIAATAAP